ncbi:MAG: hypothetical protein VW338_04755 [Rhodospirillaceae bacterium]
MPGLIDIPPRGAVITSVEVRGVAIGCVGVSGRQLWDLVRRFPEIRAVFSGGETARAEAIGRLLELGDDVIAAIIAAGTGAPGEAAESAAKDLTLDEQARLVEGVWRATFPEGLAPLVRMLSALGLADSAQ